MADCFNVSNSWLHQNLRKTFLHFGMHKLVAICSTLTTCNIIQQHNLLTLHVEKNAFLRVKTVHPKRAVETAVFVRNKDLKGHDPT